jgi:phosphatidylserine decarboxylase
MNYVFTYVKKYLGILLLILLIGVYFFNIYIIGVSLAFIFILFYFFRQPSYKKTRDKKYLYAPTYGKIIKIREVEGLLQIATFIRLYDPHIQYIPYDGYIKEQIYKEGEFNPAYLFKKGKYNEKLIHNLQTDKGLISIVQIAGVIARTIEKFKNKNQFVKQKEELGLIRFGSRCDIFIPLSNHMNVLVKEGDIIEGAITKLIEFK